MSFFANVSLRGTLNSRIPVTGVSDMGPPVINTGTINVPTLWVCWTLGMGDVVWYQEQPPYSVKGPKRLAARHLLTGEEIYREEANYRFEGLWAGDLLLTVGVRSV